MADNALFKLARQPQVKQRGTILPIAEYDDGSYGMAWPEMLHAPAMAFKRAVDSGMPLSTTDPDAADAAYRDMGEVALGTMFGGSVASMGSGAARGAVGSAGGKLTQPQGIRAYHGSPHDFDRFSLDAIGTGEGAQAYGHGLYFAEAEDVARGYRDALSKFNPAIDGRPIIEAYSDGSLPGIIAAKIGVPRSEGISAAYIMADSVRTGRPIGEILSERIAREKEFYGYSTTEEWAGKLQDIAPASTPGRLYEVNIKADPDQFLDWDKPLSQQSEALRDRFKNSAAWKALEDQQKKQIEQVLSGNSIFPPTPERLAKFSAPFDNEKIAALLSQLGPEDATNALREAGIPGIRYLDGASRGAGEGSSNYVVFDENLIDILRKYQNPPTGAALPLAADGGEQQDIEPALMAYLKQIGLY